GLSEYPATLDLIFSAVMKPRVDSRAMTRFTSRSTFEVAIYCSLDGSVGARITCRLHAGDEPFHPLVDRAERVLAQHCALRLVVEFEVHPVDGEVAAGRLGGADELAAQPGASGLRRMVDGLGDLLVGGDARRQALALQQIEHAAPALDVVIRQVQ